jgi:hypothetical protein
VSSQSGFLLAQLTNVVTQLPDPGTTCMAIQHSAFRNSLETVRFCRHFGLFPRQAVSSGRVATPESAAASRSQRPPASRANTPIGAAGEPTDRLEEPNRGRPLEFDDRVVFVTYHPSAVLRGDERADDLREALVGDLSSARRAAESTPKEAIDGH